MLLPKVQLVLGPSVVVLDENSSPVSTPGEENLLCPSSSASCQPLMRVCSCCRDEHRSGHRRGRSLHQRRRDPEVCSAGTGGAGSLVQPGPAWSSLVLLVQLSPELLRSRMEGCSPSPVIRCSSSAGHHQLCVCSRPGPQPWGGFCCGPPQSVPAAAPSAPGPGPHVAAGPEQQRHQGE